MILHRNKKFAQRFVRSLSRNAGEGWGEGWGEGTCMTGAIIKEAGGQHAR